MTEQTNRRDFVKDSVAVGTAFWVGSSMVQAQSSSPLEKLNIACIGAEGKGSSDTDNSANAGANVVALCDIDDNRLQKKGRRYRRNDVQLFHDYRYMLSKLEDRIDAVTVSTPDHSHAPAAVMAMRMGKHVYCQKPLTWSIGEARRMREVAKETGVITQMGNQGTSQDGLREAVEVVKSGGIGEVREVHIWTNRPVWPQGSGRPTDTPPVPKNIKWDLFIGPAPYRPYHPDYQPFKWRGWLDFGTGALGDMACHTANMAVMGLDLFEPTSFEAVENTGLTDNESYPKFSVIKFQFPKRGDLPPCTVHWYDGGKTPDPALLEGEKMVKSGALLVGSEGKLYTPNDYAKEYTLLSREKFADYKPPEPFLPRVNKIGTFDQNHMGEFISACRGETRDDGTPIECMSNFEYAGRLTETILCGNLALRSDKKVEWDAANMQCTNAPELQQFVTREYRHGWHDLV